MFFRFPLVYLYSCLMISQLLFNSSILSAAIITAEDGLSIPERAIDTITELNLIEKSEINNKHKEYSGKGSETNKNKAVDLSLESKIPKLSKYKYSSQNNKVIVSPFRSEQNILQRENSSILETTYGKLNEIMDEEMLDNTELIVREFNQKLNSLNNNINLKLQSFSEDILIINNLFPVLAENNWNNGKINNYGPVRQQGNNTDTYLLLAGVNSSPTEAVEEPEGVFGFIMMLPKYIFNIDYLVKGLAILFLVTGIYKLLYFVMNKTW